ncbi:hypothetical protein F5Y04DRAFT_179085 [Hypomontagnella monticulosa]|nr:hypothetical protein F5Y04DRAFT_179085 [Hypomontagnella monticulosa]
MNGNGVNGDEKPNPVGKKPKAKIIRSLGYLERFEAAMISLDFYRSSMVTCRFTIPARFLPGPELESQDELHRRLESAVAAVVMEHPFLRVGLRGEHARKPAFVELEAVDFARHIEWRSFGSIAEYEAQLRGLIRSRLDVKVPQPEDAPSWRILMLCAEDFVDVMFEWGHVHTDGISAKIFHEDLLRYLNSTGDGSGADVEAGVVPSEFNPETRILTIPISRRRDLPPPLHSLCKFTLSSRWAASTLWRELKPASFQDDSSTGLLATWAPLKITPYETQYRHFSIDHATLQTILTACREHKTTLTGLIHALAHVSLATRLDAKDARAFTGSTILNLRPIVAAAEPRLQAKEVRSKALDLSRTMGNFVTITDHEFDSAWVAQVREAVRAKKEGDKQEGEDGLTVPESLVWPIAESVRAGLQKRLDEGTKNDMIGLLKFIPDFRTLLKDWTKKPRGHGVVITNLGVIDGSPADKVSDDTADTVEASSKWRIDRAIFSISPEAHGAAITICPVAVKGKELYISVDWQDCALDSALVEGMTTDLEAWLRVLGRQR